MWNIFIILVLSRSERIFLPPLSFIEKVRRVGSVVEERVGQAQTLISFDPTAK